MRTVDSWFSFENRCLLCGEMIGGLVGNRTQHIQRHTREGYLGDQLDQIKTHPFGFPGPPLGQQPSPPKMTEEERYEEAKGMGWENDPTGSTHIPIPKQ